MDVNVLFKVTCPDSKIHGANVRPTWGRQEPGGTHVGHTTLAIWDTLNHPALCLFRTEHWSLCLHIFITYSWHIFNTISQHVLTAESGVIFVFIFAGVVCPRSSPDLRDVVQLRHDSCAIWLCRWRVAGVVPGHWSTTTSTHRTHQFRHRRANNWHTKSGRLRSLLQRKVMLWYRKASHITGPLWGESTGHQWIPSHMAINVEHWCFLCCSLNYLSNKQLSWWWFGNHGACLLSFWYIKYLHKVFLCFAWLLWCFSSHENSQDDD